ncbi:MAG: hypothetical protein KAV40_03505 [Thermoplasmatales archaeon]|nr:hypothetical protein [Thermoplasmatales archaeon]
MNKHLLIIIVTVVTLILYILLYNQINVFLTLFLTMILIAITYSYYDITTKTMWHQALPDVQKDYRSAEMLSAIETLWNFYRDCKSRKLSLSKEYENRVNAEKIQISQRHIKIDEGLSYKRRLVTHFYYHLGDIYKRGILPEKIIFDHWNPVDLDIIFDIIIPLDKKQEKMVGLDKVRKSRGIEKKELQKLKELHKASYRCYGMKYPKKYESYQI